MSAFTPGHGGARRPSVPLVAAAAALLAACGTAGTGGGATPPPTAEPERFSYSQFAVTYQGSSHGRSEQEISGQRTASEFSLRYYLTTTAVQSGEAARLTMTLDSVPYVSGAGAGFSATDAQEAAGTTFTGFLSPEGEIMAFEGGDTTISLVQQLATGFRYFFPRIPPEGVAAGQSWTDSLESTTRAGLLEIQVKTVNRHEAVGWIEHTEGRALHVASVADYTLSGGGTQGGMDITIEGTGIRHEHRYLAEDGRYLGGTAADTSNSTALVAAMGMSIPITRIKFDTLTVVR